MGKVRQVCKCGHVYKKHKYINAFEQPCSKCDCKNFDLRLKKTSHNTGFQHSEEDNEWN